MTFAQPAFLLFLLLVPLIALGAWLADRQRTRAWQKLVAERLRPKLAAPASPWSRWLSLGCGLLALTLLIMALAQPIAGEKKTTSLSRGRNILIAIDASRSMLARDVAPNRLTAAKTAAFDLLDRFPNDRIGLLAFAGSAQLQAPLTIDHNALRESLEQLDTENIPTGGSNLADAINLATKTFRETGQKTHGLIVLSDGELHEGRLYDATFDARQAGIFVVTIGIGTRNGDFVPDSEEEDGRFRDREGNPVLTRLKAAPLRNLAKQTNGLYLEGVGSGFGTKIETVIDRLDAFENEDRVLTTPIPRFSWFLIPALILMIASLLLRNLWKPAKPRGVPAATVAAATIALVSFPQEARAWSPAVEGYLGTRDLKNSKYEDALEHYQKALADKQDSAPGDNETARLNFGKGSALYKLGNYQRAAESFGESLLSEDPALQRDARHQLGNSLYMRTLEELKDSGGSQNAQKIDYEKLLPYLEDAISHYDEALALDEEHEPSRKHKAQTEEFLKQLKARQQEQQKQEQQQQQEGGKKQESQEQQNQDGEQKEQESGEQDQNSEEQQGQENQDQEGDQKEGEEGEQREGEEEQGEQEQGQPQTQEGDSAEEQQNQQSGEQGQKGEPVEPRDEETAEEFARRILKENADFQKDALRQRGRQIRPEKDW
jgi:Ca-activated chloride channel family protein